MWLDHDALFMNFAVSLDFLTGPSYARPAAMPSPVLLRTRCGVSNSAS